MLVTVYQPDRVMVNVTVAQRSPRLPDQRGRGRGGQEAQNPDRNGPSPATHPVSLTPSAHQGQQAIYQASARAYSSKHFIRPGLPAIDRPCSMPTMP